MLSSTAEFSSLGQYLKSNNHDKYNSSKTPTSNSGAERMNGTFKKLSTKDTQGGINNGNNHDNKNLKHTNQYAS